MKSTLLVRRPGSGRMPSSQRHRVTLCIEPLEDRRLLSRNIVSLDNSWQFIRQDVPGAQAVSFNDSAWTTVSLPHTWNNLDGQDGGNDYYRGIGWYRRHYTVPASLSGQELFIKFDGANLITDLYVNGAFVGEHVGGFAAFVWDLTPYLTIGGDNVLAVKVNNALYQGAIPLSGDITWDGGLYRHVNLITTDPLHVSLTDYASPGVYLQQTNVSSSWANLQVTTKLQNDSAVPRQATVVANIVDAANNLVQALANSVTLAAHAGMDVVENTTLVNPHLWNGRSDPYMYQVRVQVIDSVSGIAVDEVDQSLGLRYFSIDPNNGFFLNGQYLDLHGVGLHQDRLNEGWALSDADQVQDINLIKEIGATFVRLTLYQHPPKTYDLLDSAGIIAWSDLPLIDSVVVSSLFFNNVKQQLIEMIRQNYNHPAVFFWGLYDELSDNGTTEQLVSQLVQLAHQEDPSRPTTAATNLSNDKPINYLPDYTGFNKYYGWYYGSAYDFGPWADSIHAAYPYRPIGVSEYGAGASIYQHQINAWYPQYPAYTWHPEEYQDLFHETYWKQMKTRPFLWLKDVWDMFDFAVDARNEGDTPGRNDKGLVTYDRQTRKDAFYWYKANWSTDPVLYITSRSYINRPSNVVDLKVYSNLTAAQLSVNGVVVGTQTGTDDIIQWTGIHLAPGANTITVTAMQGGVPYTDTVTWYTPITLGGVPFARINFQPLGVTVPAGYLPDYGYVFGDRGNGLSYGWDTDNTANTYVRGVASDPRYDTGIAMETPTGGHIWQIAVPNGTYDIHLVSGDPSYFDSIDEIAVEGVLAVSGGVNTLSRYQEAWRSITVTNGLLTITNTTGSKNDKLDFIEINQTSVASHPGAATHYAVTTSAGSTAGSGSSVTVSALDANGNIATGYTGRVHFTSSDGQAVLPADYTFGSGDSGVHTFLNAIILKTAGNQTVTASDMASSSITGNASVAVSAGPATHYTLSASANVIAGSAFGVIVTALDAYGNIATSYTGTAHFISSDPQASLLADYSFATSDGGVHAFTNAITFKTAGSQSLLAMDRANGSISGSATVGVNAAAATLYSVSAPASSTASSALSITVTALDAYGNIATGYTGTVHFISSDAQASLPADYTFGNGDSGVHVFSNTIAFRTAGSQSVLAMDRANGSISGSATIAVSAAPATCYTISTPGNGIAGSAFGVIVTALDAYGNIATGYTGTVHFISSDLQASLVADYSFATSDGGVHAFSNAITFRTAGSQSVLAMDRANGSISGSATVGVNAAVATHYTISAPASSTAGSAFSVTVAALDAYGNTATGYTGTVHFMSSDAQALLMSDYTFVSGDAGSHTFSNVLTLKTAGSQTLTAIDTVTGSINGSATVGITAAMATLYNVSAPASSTAGSALSITVTAVDAYGNIATGYAGTVHFASSDARAVVPADYTFVGGDGGTHTFSNAITLKTAGSQSITALDTITGSITGTSPNLMVKPLAASQLGISAPGSATAGIPFDIRVMALDPYGNIDTNYQGTVQFTTSDPTAGQVQASYTFTATDSGVHTFVAAVALFTAGKQTIAATDVASGITGTATVVIAPAPANHFALSAPAHVTARMPFDLTITALDPYGNTDTNYQGTVHFTASDSGLGVVLPADYTFAASDQGVHIFAGGFTLITVGTQTLTATDTAHAAFLGNATVTVDPGAAPPPSGSTSRSDSPPSTPIFEPPQVVGILRPDQRIASVDWLFTSLRKRRPTDLVVWENAASIPSIDEPAAARGRP